MFALSSASRRSSRALARRSAARRPMLTQRLGMIGRGVMRVEARVI
jgi:hypothetical protein